MIAIDREKFASNLRQLGNENGFNALYWDQCIKDLPSLKELYLNGVGNLSLPVSSEDIATIKKVAATDVTTVNPNSKHGSATQLNSSKMTADTLSNAAVERTFQHLAVLAANSVMAHPVGSDIDVGLEFSQLGISTPEGHYHKQTSYQKPGTFGKFIVLLPVKGGYEGGKLKVEKSNEISFYDYTYKSHRYFYCCALFTGCHYKWEPIKKGCMVVLDFDIVWRPSSTFVISSISLPAFLAATKEFKEVLRPWNVRNHRLGEMEEGEIVADDVEATKAITDRPHPKEKVTVHLEQLPPDVTTRDATLPDALRDQLLIIPLEETYYEVNLSFASLHGKDRQLAQILQSIDFIDVHLAIVKSSFVLNSTEPDSQNQPVKERFEISQWIHSNIGVPQLQKNRLDYPNQLISRQSKSLFICDGDAGQGSRDPVIVIQPRHESIRRLCLSQFDTMLTYLETLQSSDSEITRIHSLTCLGHALSFCREEPFRVWAVAAAKATERTLRLLKICHGFRALKEARFLLEILGKDVQTPAADENLSPAVFFEGIRNETIARAIVDLMWDIGGWQAISAPLLGLISPSRLRQMKSFTTIVTALLEYRCFPAATCVAQKICTAISSNPKLMQMLDQKDVDAYIDAIIALEYYSRGAGESLLLEQLVDPVFILLAPHQQCHLLIDLQSDFSSRLRCLPSCLQLYKRLATVLVQCDLCSPGITQEIIVKVIETYVQLGDKKILEIFMRYVLWSAGNKKETRHGIVWLEKLLVATIPSPLAKSALMGVVTEAIRIIQKCLFLPRMWEKEDKWRNDLARLFAVLLRLERFPVLADSTRLSSFAPLYKKMNPDRLSNLVVDILDQGNAHVRKHRKTHDVIQKMGYALLQHDSSSFQGGLPIQALVIILNCFADIPGLSLARQFLADICRIEKWTSPSKNLLIKTILSTEELWSKFIEKETLAGFVRNSQTALLRSWIAGLQSIISSSSGSVELRADIASCFLYSIGEEKKYCCRRTDQSSTLFTNDLFSSLFDKLPAQGLAHLLVDIYQADAKEVPCLKKFHTTLNLYRDVCHRFVDKEDLVSWMKSADDMVIETTKSLLWLDDESVLAFIDKIAAACPAEEPNDIVRRIAESVDILESFPQSRNAVCRLVESRLSAVTQFLEKEAVEAWRIPSASVADHPVVEEFLRSTAQQMTYANFSSTEKAHQFAAVLSESGFPIQVGVEGEDFKAKCEIVKLARNISKPNSKELLVSEKSVLELIFVELKAQLETGIVEKNEVDDDDDVTILPCPKRTRLELPVIDLSFD